MAVFDSIAYKVVNSKYLNLKIIHISTMLLAKMRFDR